MRRRLVATIVVIGAAAAGAGAVARHRLGAGHRAPGGVLMGDAAGYDRMGRRLLGRFYAGIAADVAAAVPAGARVLEVGCGPGHLSLLLAGRHGLDVTGLDLDPAMVTRARANAERSAGPRRPAFVVGDVASLAFPDGTFDLVVSTLSMHHWTQRSAGLTEIARVLRPDGRALVWDLRPGAVPLHRHAPDPVEPARGTPLRVVRATPWRWPLRFALTQRVELAPAGSARGADPHG
jgi:SAM-dependent methyltransferase